MLLSYPECREAFRHAGPRRVALESHAIGAAGPDGEELTIDVARLGADRPSAVLVVLSGVHGVEGFAGSMIQCELLSRVGSDDLASTAVVLVHAVNPYGMAWWRRQNESNVDLNRNWGRSELADPPQNPAYDEVHELLCPGGLEPPAAEPFLAALRDLVAKRGGAWVKAAISRGQYRHADGLYFGGDRTELSPLIVADVVRRHAAGAELVVAIDLHTGHGARGTYTILSDAPPSSERARWLRDTFDPERVELTTEPGATTPAKHGSITAGLAELVGDAVYRSATFELGTVSDGRMIVAERAEHWAHRVGRADDPRVAQIRREHLHCSAPDDPEWQASARQHGRTVLDAALRSILAASRRPPGSTAS